MDIKIVVGVLCSVLCGPVWAEACQVSTQPASQGLAQVNGQTCYEFRDMPAGSIDWSCSNQSKDGLTSQKQKVDTCPSGAKNTCSATLTQESLANERSTSKVPGQGTFQIPNGAKVITYYYDMKDQSQARIDCEHGGGTWK
ncbi:MAG: hypothetical protein JWP80_1770 [Pseudomonas sp.]|nr:hypothetical protein [Pseudomonas sp.]